MFDDIENKDHEIETANSLRLLGRTHFLISMRKPHIAFLFMLVWTAITILALLWGFPYNMPDNVHSDYGLPLTWGTNTTSTITGPANIWTVTLSNLLVDLVFWLGIMIATNAALLYINGSSR